MRLFVALNLPAAERERLHGEVCRLRERAFPVRWVGPAQLHLTLKFLGDVPDEREAEIAGAVEGAARTGRPFDLVLGGVGGFPHLRRPRVVWVGVEAAPELSALYEELERRFESLGFERESRALHPHITLGRATRDARAAGFRGMEPAAASIDYRARVRVETLDLMRSRLRPTGAEYEVRRAAPLGAAGAGAGAGPA